MKKCPYCQHELKGSLSTKCSNCGNTIRTNKYIYYALVAPLVALACLFWSFIFWRLKNTEDTSDFYIAAIVCATIFIVAEIFIICICVITKKKELLNGEQYLISHAEEQERRAIAEREEQECCTQLERDDLFYKTESETARKARLKREREEAQILWEQKQRERQAQLEREEQERQARAERAEQERQARAERARIARAEKKERLRLQQLEEQKQRELAQEQKIKSFVQKTIEFRQDQNLQKIIERFAWGKFAISQIELLALQKCQNFGVAQSDIEKGYLGDIDKKSLANITRLISLPAQTEYQVDKKIIAQIDDLVDGLVLNGNIEANDIATQLALTLMFLEVCQKHEAEIWESIDEDDKKLKDLDLLKKYYNQDHSFILERLIFLHHNKKCLRIVLEKDLMNYIQENLPKIKRIKMLELGDERIDRINISQVDLMSGIEFEQFIAKIFTKMGFRTRITKASGDQGIDIIAERDDYVLGIQAKRYTGRVGNSAIQEAVAGKNYYHCADVMVVTSNYFTKEATELAAVNNVRLWDRKDLIEKIEEYF